MVLPQHLLLHAVRAGDYVTAREAWDAAVATPTLEVGCHVVAYALAVLTSRRAPRGPPPAAPRTMVDPARVGFGQIVCYGVAEPEEYAALTALVVDMISTRRVCGDGDDVDGATCRHVIVGDIDVALAAETNVCVFHAACARHLLVHGREPVADAETVWSCLLAGAKRGASDVFHALFSSPATWTLLPWDEPAWRALLQAAVPAHGHFRADILCAILDRLYVCTGVVDGRHVAGVSCFTTTVMAVVARHGLTNLLDEMLDLVTPEVELECKAHSIPIDAQWQQPHVRLLCNACAGLSVTSVSKVVGRFSYTLRELRQAYLRTCAVVTAARGLDHDPAEAAICIFGILHAQLSHEPDGSRGSCGGGEAANEEEDVSCPLQVALYTYFPNARLLRYLCVPPACHAVWRFPQSDWRKLMRPLYFGITDAGFVAVLPNILAQGMVLSPATFVDMGCFMAPASAMALLAAQPAAVRPACAASMARGALRQMQYATLVALRRDMGVEPARQDWVLACSEVEDGDDNVNELPLGRAVLTGCGRAIDRLLDHNYCLSLHDGTGRTIYDVLYGIDKRCTSVVPPLDDDYDTGYGRPSSDTRIPCRVWSGRLGLCTVDLQTVFVSRRLHGQRTGGCIRLCLHSKRGRHGAMAGQQSVVVSVV